MRSFLKWSAILGFAFVLVFVGFLWTLYGIAPQPSSSQAPVTQSVIQPQPAAPPAAPAQTTQSTQTLVVDKQSQQANNAPTQPQEPEQQSAPQTSEIVPQQTVADSTSLEPVPLPDAPEPDDDPEPEDQAAVSGDSFLGGRVLDGSGRPLAQVQVLAQHRTDGLTTASALRTSSNEEGRFRFDDIANGDYSVSNGPVSGYGERTVYVRSGTESVDLVLERLRQVQVTGTVKDPDGRPLAAVEVNAAGAAGAIKTNTSGGFAVAVQMQAGQTTSLRFTRTGFSERFEAVNAAEIDTSNRVNVDVVMNPLGDISYRGRVSDDLGDPVVGELVRLFSTNASQAQRATTDSLGNFEITGLSTASDWRLAIIPKQGYERYEAGPFKIQAANDAVEIVLKRTTLARLSGTVVDPLGSPVSDISLVFTPLAAPGSFHTQNADAGGRFVVEEIAAGELRVSTQAQPHMDISGITLLPGDNREVTLVVDRGPYKLNGYIRDGQDNGVKAELLLTWTHPDGGLTSTSFRESISDSNGYYSFTGLGQGLHQLTVLTSNEGNVVRKFNVGSDAEQQDVELP